MTGSVASAISGPWGGAVFGWQEKDQEMIFGGSKPCTVPVLRDKCEVIRLLRMSKDCAVQALVINELSDHGKAKPGHVHLDHRGQARRFKLAVLCHFLPEEQLTLRGSIPFPPPRLNSVHQA